MKHLPKVIFQNETILAMDKPSGLLSVPDRFDNSKPSLATFLLKDFPSARPLHRLDFETSGIMLFCLDENAFGWYSDQFEQRIISKKYLAIVEGRCHESEGLIDKPLYVHTTGKVTIDKRGKPSQTKWSVKERFLHHALVEAEPLTGRTHQVRVHMASIGHPVVSDPFYGSGEPLFLSSLKGKNKYRLGKDEESERPLLSRLALHAAGIRFTDFNSKLPIQLESPLHKDMQVSILKLRQYQPWAP